MTRLLFECVECTELCVRARLSPREVKLTVLCSGHSVRRASGAGRAHEAARAPTKEVVGALQLMAALVRARRHVYVGHVQLRARGDWRQRTQ